jgi:glycosyltransferase involved in cell wall biosynthesis
MSEANTIFSHQLEIALRLSPSYSRIMVLSNEMPTGKLPINMTVMPTGWVNGSKLLSALRFLRIGTWALIRYRPDVIFCHMTEVQNLILAPLARIVRIPIYLWYAHMSLSPYLRISYLVSNGIITSTKFSCPIKGSKVIEIGQAIDSATFNGPEFRGPIRKLIHLGRFDESKNIAALIETVSSMRNEYPELTLEIIGTASNPKNQSYANSILKKYKEEKWLKFLPSIPRAQVPKKLIESDCFIHAYEGSLDKILVEATFVRRPVVTRNHGYLEEFGTWSDSIPSTLELELRSLLIRSDKEIAIEVNRRYEIATNNHDISSWVDKLNSILIR